MKKNRIIVMLLIASLMLSALTACGGSGGPEGSEGNDAATEETVEKEARTTDNYDTVEEGGVRFRMPDYFGEPESSGDVRNYYAETGEGATLLQLYSSEMLLDEENFADQSRRIYDSYASGIRNSDGVSDFRDGGVDDLTLECGLHCMLYNYSFKMSGIPCNTFLALINNTEANQVILVALVQSERSEYDYESAFMTMVRSCELTGGAPEQKETSEPEVTPEPDAGVADDDPSLISPEFKQTMDDYEAWFDHYCDVMKRYEEDPTNIDLMYEMTDLLAEEGEMLEKMESMDQSEMNAAELAYYLEVTARIEKKLLEAAGY